MSANLRATTKLVGWEDHTKKSSFLLLCDKYRIESNKQELMYLYNRAEVAMSSQVDYFTEVIAICDTLLALRKRKISSIIVGNIKEIKFSSSDIVSRRIEDSLNEALLLVCLDLFDDSDPHNVGYVEQYSVDTGNELYLIWKDHQEQVQKELERRDALTESEIFDEDISGYDISKYSRLRDTEIELIKSTYERFLDRETKAEGRFKKAEGVHSKNAKLGRLARKIMEKLPEDMEHKHLFVADFLLASGALSYRGESWLEVFVDKSDNEKERFVRIWIDRSLQK